MQRVNTNCGLVQIGGVSATELKALELEMLKQLGYCLFVSEEQVAHCLVQLKVLARTPLDGCSLRRSKKRVKEEGDVQ